MRNAGGDAAIAERYRPVKDLRRDAYDMGYIGSSASNSTSTATKTLPACPHSTPAKAGHPGQEVSR